MRNVVLMLLLLAFVPLRAQISQDFLIGLALGDDYSSESSEFIEEILAEDLAPEGFIGKGINLLAMSSFFQRNKVFRQRISFSSKSIEIRSFLGQTSPSNGDIKRSQSFGIHAEVIPGRFKLVFGDYKTDFGLGICFSTNKRFISMNTSPHLLVNRPKGLKAYAGSDQLNFLRGAGLSYQYKKTTLTGFLSARDEADSNLSDIINGFHLAWESDRLHLGWGIYHLNHSNSEALRIGLSAKLLRKKGILFGEIAKDLLAGYAAQFGWSRFPYDGLALTTQVLIGSSDYYQRFSSLALTSKDFANIRQSIFSIEQSLPRSWILKFCLLWQDEPSLTPKADHPKEKIKVRLNLLSNPFNENQWSAAATYQNDCADIQILRRFAKDGSPLFLSFNALCRMEKFKTRAFRKGYRFGFNAAFPSLNRWPGFKFGVNYFSIEEGVSRLYQYEPDLLYQFSIPVMTGTGTRAFLLINWKWLPAFELQLKLSKTVKINLHDQDKSEFKIQLIYRPEFDNNRSRNANSRSWN